MRRGTGTNLSLAGLLAVVERKHGQALPGIHAICRRGFSHFEWVAADKIMEGILAILRASNPAKPPKLGRDAFVTDVDSAADLVINVATSLKVPDFTDEEVLPFAIEYVLHQLHRLLESDEIEKGLTFKLYFLSQAAKQLGINEIDEGITQGELDVIIARADRLHTLGKKLGEKGAFAWLPTTVAQVAHFLPPQPGGDSLQDRIDEHRQFFENIVGRAASDNQFKRSDAEVLEAVASARDKIRARNERRAQFQTAFASVLTALGMTIDGAAFKFSSDLPDLSGTENCRVTIMNGPIPNSFQIRVTPGKEAPEGIGAILELLGIGGAR